MAKVTWRNLVQATPTKDEMECPDCGLPWGDGPRCQNCGLDVEDLRAAAAWMGVGR